MIIPPADRLNEVKEYYFSKKLQEIRDLEAKGMDILNLGIGSPDLPPSKETIEALVASSHSPSNHGYQPYRGIASLRKAISKYQAGVYGIELDPDTEILPLMGSKEGITHISLAFLNPGDKVLVPELGYPAYSAVSEMVGAKTVQYPLKEDDGCWIPDWSKMDSTAYTDAKIMWVNYPHMPTGTPPSAGLFSEIITYAKKNQILVCHDNPYSRVLNQAEPVSLLSFEDAKDNCIELNSMSKSHNMAGWRIGWVSGSKDYIDTILRIKSNFDSGMFKGLQDAAVLALENPESWHQERNQIYADRRQWVKKILDRLGCTYNKNQVGMFIWAKIPENVDDVERWIDHILYNNHVFITPGFVFGEKGRDYIRLSLCSDQTMFEEAYKRLGNINFK
ncbi:pyridoxal phosphate-dependent aminotransferase [Bacteroidota bacterium]